MDPLRQLLQRQPEPQLTHQAMTQYMMRNPEMRNQLLAAILGPSPPQDANLRSSQILNESAAVVDPMMGSAVSRLLGFGVPDQVWLNESHGLARREQGRYR